MRPDAFVLHHVAKALANVLAGRGATPAAVRRAASGDPGAAAVLVDIIQARADAASVVEGLRALLALAMAGDTGAVVRGPGVAGAVVGALEGDAGGGGDDEIARTAAGFVRMVVVRDDAAAAALLAAGGGGGADAGGSVLEARLAALVGHASGRVADMAAHALSELALGGGGGGRDGAGAASRLAVLAGPAARHGAAAATLLLGGAGARLGALRDAEGSAVWAPLAAAGGSSEAPPSEQPQYAWASGAELCFFYDAEARRVVWLERGRAVAAASVAALADVATSGVLADVAVAAVILRHIDLPRSPALGIDPSTARLLLGVLGYPAPEAAVFVCWVMEEVLEGPVGPALAAQLFDAVGVGWLLRVLVPNVLVTPVDSRAAGDWRPAASLAAALARGQALRVLLRLLRADAGGVVGALAQRDVIVALLGAACAALSGAMRELRGPHGGAAAGGSGVAEVGSTASLLRDAAEWPVLIRELVTRPEAARVAQRDGGALAALLQCLQMPDAALRAAGLAGLDAVLSGDLSREELIALARLCVGALAAVAMDEEEGDAEPAALATRCLRALAVVDEAAATALEVLAARGEEAAVAAEAAAPVAAAAAPGAPVAAGAGSGMDAYDARADAPRNNSAVMGAVAGRAPPAASAVASVEYGAPLSGGEYNGAAVFAGPPHPPPPQQQQKLQPPPPPQQQEYAAGAAASDGGAVDTTEARSRSLRRPDAAVAELRRALEGVPARAWNDEYQALLCAAARAVTLERHVAVAAGLRALVDEFAAAAVVVARAIVAGLYCASAAIVPPLAAGGVAGGDKYEHRGIFLKVVREDARVYADYETAARVAAHEFSSLELIARAAAGSALRTSMQVLLDVAGHRISATAALPIGRGTLVYVACARALAVEPRVTLRARAGTARLMRARASR